MYETGFFSDPDAIDTTYDRKVEDIDSWKRALSQFDEVIEGLSPMLASLAGHSVTVRPGSATRALSANEIEVLPSRELTSPIHHTRSMCDRRDRGTGLQRCSGCATVERITAELFHEIAHIRGKSFNQIPVGGGKFKTAYEIAGDENEENAWILNALDDTRVETKIRIDNAGIAATLDAMWSSTAHEGIEVEYQSDPVYWDQIDQDQQAILACHFIGYKPDYMQYLDPYVQKTILGDETLVGFIEQAAEHSKDVSQALSYVKLIRDRLHRLGFFTPIPEPPPMPSEGDSNDDNGAASESDSSRKDEPTSDDSGNSGDNDGSRDDDSDGVDGNDDSPSADGDEDNGEDAPESEDGDSGDSSEGDDTESVGGTGDVLREPSPDESSDSGDDSGDSDGDDQVDSSERSEGSGNDSDNSESSDDGPSKEDSQSSEGDSESKSDAPGESANQDGNGPGPESVPADGLPQPAEESSGDADAEQSAGGSGQSLEGQPSPAHELPVPVREAKPRVDPRAAGLECSAVEAHESKPLTWKEAEALDAAIQIVAQEAELKNDDETDGTGGGWAAPNEKPADNIVIRGLVNSTSWSGNKDGDYQEVTFDNSVVIKAFTVLKPIFADNKRSRHQTNLTSGKINTRALRRFEAGDDDRLFKKKVVKKKKDYFAVITIDLSGSTKGETLRMEKAAAAIQAEVMSRLGVKFEIWGNYGSLTNLHVFPVKLADEPWGVTQKARLANLPSRAGNRDSDMVRLGRQRMDKVRASEKILFFYTDGQFTADKLMMSELKIFAKTPGYTLIGVGFETNSPSRFGLETVQLDEPADLHKISEVLTKHLIG